MNCFKQLHDQNLDTEEGKSQFLLHECIYAGKDIFLRVTDPLGSGNVSTYKFSALHSRIHVRFSWRILQVLMRFAHRLTEMFSWEFLVAFEANSNQHYTWHPIWPYKCLAFSATQRIIGIIGATACPKQVSLVLQGFIGYGNYQITSFCWHSQLLTPSQSWPTSQRAAASPFFKPGHRTISSLCHTP